MRRISLFKKLISFFLLLVFLQKAGGTLFLHNALHTKNCNSEFPAGHHEKNISAANCTCIDDFMMPFAGSSEIIIPSIPVVHQQIHIAYSEQLYFHTSLFSSLRAPPVA